MGATPLLLACKTADLPLMKLLIELGADPRLANVDGCAPILAAAGVGTVAVDEEPGTEPEVLAALDYLLSLGVDLHGVDANGESAMHGAAYRAFPKVVSYLHEKGLRPKRGIIRTNMGGVHSILQTVNGQGASSRILR